MRLSPWRLCAAAVAVALMSGIAWAQSTSELWAMLDRQGDQPQAQHEESLALHRQALALAEREAGVDAANVKWQHAIWRSAAKVGALLVEFERHEEALAVFNQGLEAARRLAKAQPDVGEWQRAVAMLLIGRGDALVELKRPQEALQAYREALSVSEKLAAARGAPATTRRSIMVAQGKIGDVLWEQGDLAGALAVHKAAREVAKTRAVPGDAATQDDLATTNEAVGVTLTGLGSFDEALAVLREAQAIREQLQAQRRDSSRLYGLSTTQELIGKAFLKQGNLARSLEAFETSLKLRQTAHAEDPNNPAWEFATANSYGHIGGVLALMGRRDQARESLQKARAITARHGFDTTLLDDQLVRLR
jgi:tetratricopeptide (TPR) repeat protein